jgi:hypothetical protein
LKALGALFLQVLKLCETAGLVKLGHCANWFTVLDTVVWDTGWLLSEDSILGRTLHTLIGYTDQPTEMQLVTYVAVVAVTVALMRLIGRNGLGTRLTGFGNRRPIRGSAANEVVIDAGQLDGFRIIAPKPLREPAGRKPKKTSSRPADKAVERKAAVAYEREQKRRDRERAREEAARQKEREHRQQAVDKAQSALNKAEREHAEKAGAIQAEADAIEKRAQAENARWKKEKGRLDAALQRARG